MYGPTFDSLAPPALSTSRTTTRIVQMPQLTTARRTLSSTTSSRTCPPIGTREARTPRLAPATSPVMVNAAGTCGSLAVVTSSPRSSTASSRPSRTIAGVSPPPATYGTACSPRTDIAQFPAAAASTVTRHTCACVPSLSSPVYDCRTGSGVVGASTTLRRYLAGTADGRALYASTAATGMTEPTNWRSASIAACSSK